MAEKMKVSYGVDLVFCIDTTMSMEPILNVVKKNALNFYSDIIAGMEAKNKKIDHLRIRLIAFRDYYFDREKAMLVTDFFNFPEQANEFEMCVNSLDVDGGGDEPEDGLEALAYAMKSPWNGQARKRRHIIVVWTDASTHDLGFGKTAANYPKGMAKNFEELSAWWGNEATPGIMDENAKRLILFTPYRKSWSTIMNSWNQVVHYESEAGLGLDKVDYEQILGSIVNSI